jgi:hypothetical protein
VNQTLYRKLQSIEWNLIAHTAEAAALVGKKQYWKSK